MRQLALPLWGESERTLPMTRGDCPEERPCPYVSCRHHLLIESVRLVGRRHEAIDVSRVAVQIAGRYPETWTDREIESILRSMPETCVLDVAERGGLSQPDVARIMGVGRTRIEAVEREAADRMKEGMADDY